MKKLHAVVAVVAVAAILVGGCHQPAGVGGDGRAIYWFFLFEPGSQSLPDSDGLFIGQGRLDKLSADSLRLSVARIVGAPADSLWLRSSYFVVQTSRTARAFKNSRGEGLAIAARAIDGTVLLTIATCAGRGTRVLDDQRLRPTDLIVLFVTLEGRHYLSAIQAIPGTPTSENDPVAESRDRFVEAVRELRPTHLVDLVPEDIADATEACR